MNPYVYTKRKQVAPPSAWSLVKSVFTDHISSVLAVAIIVLAAGSAMAVTVLAVPELAADNSAPVAHSFALGPMPQVLGDSTTAVAAPVIDDSSLEAGVTIPTVRMQTKAVGFDSSIGRWDYVISYAVPQLTASGTITIGTYVVSSTLTAKSGKVETGAILKPSTTYHVTFWVTDASGNKAAAGMAEIKTGKAKSSNDHGVTFITPCLNQTPGQGTSTPPVITPTTNATSTSSGAMFCVKTKDDKMICPRPPLCGPIRLDGRPFGSSTSTPPHGPGASSTPPHSDDQLNSPSFDPSLPPAPRK